MKARRRLLFWVRWAASFMLVFTLLAPAHFVGAVAHGLESSAVDVTSCPDDDEGCPPNCSICPCGERPCVPSAPAVEVAPVETSAEAPRDERVNVLRDRIAHVRVDRPPRTCA